MVELNPVRAALVGKTLKVGGSWGLAVSQDGGFTHL